MNVPIEPFVGPAISLSQKLIAYFSTRKRVFHSSDQYGSFLRKIVTQSKHPNTYYVSIGEDDWVSAWLTRLFSDASTAQSKKPQINRIVIKHINIKVAQKFEKVGILAPGFCNRMLSNIKLIQNDAEVQHNKIEVVLKQWDNAALPPFHGHVYGDWTLIGKWSPDFKGRATVRTSLEVLHKDVDANYYNRIIRAFE